MKSDKHTGKPKLTLEQVILAVSELKHVSGRKLAKMWGVSHATVNNARSGNSWKTQLTLLGFPTPAVPQRKRPVMQSKAPLKENASLQSTQV
jgi:hypothetical protein